MAKMMSFMVPMNSTRLQLTKFFTLFHSKFEMPPKSKVVSLEKLDSKNWTTFILGDFEVVR
jgi:hypothetical protein